MTYFEQKRMQSALQLMMCDPETNYVVTAAFNRKLTHAGAKRLLGRWHAQVDRERLGKRWAAKPTDQRTFFIAVPEHVDSNFHYHLIVKVPSKRDVFEEWAVAIWEDVALGGSLKFDRLLTHEDRAAAVSYSTKEAWKNDQIENFVVSTEFSTKLG